MRWWLLIALVGCRYHAPPGPELDAPAGGGISIPDVDAPLPADQRCLARYGGIDSYDLCASDDTSCTFYAHTDDTSCGVVCAAAGGTCIESRDGDCSDFATNPTHDCANTLGDQVCFCSN